MVRRLIAFTTALLIALWLTGISDAVQIRDRCYMTTATVGTGTITLGSAVSGFQTFAGCGITNAQVVRYCVEDGAAYETGTGTYTTSGTTLSRTVLESSNGDAAISLSGTAQVFVCALTADIPSETTPTDTGVIPGTDYYMAMEGGVLKRVLIPVTDIQTMTATGSGDSWDKPTGGQTMCLVQLWAGGGSGGEGVAAAAAAGGGGGAYKERKIAMSLLAATEQVTVAAGGASQTTTSTAGNVGGNTTFGSGATLLTAHGGGGGGSGATGSAGGGGGGVRAAGSGGGTGITGGATDTLIVGSVGNVTVGPYGNPGGNGIATLNAVTPLASQLGGAGGGGSTGDATGTNAPGGSSEWGGGGGGAGAEDSAPGAGAGGLSQFGGNGGAGAFDTNLGTAGVQPGGGGGGSEAGNSGKGGDGKAVITCW